ncbi:MAG: 30S ribosomal protein S9 [Cytophagales bacterium]|nr:30S ribosomal protein S9 [Marinoscillum sp.]MAK07163.1 30S ribosomal protein S9 [Marinoscillum sp.]OUX26627.1 MAG: 30S ribosomal protein S9 [Flammeovirgaceae bacterium TMED262]PDH45754.1 MAG: 30S ribosomal protein S9 [Rhodothermaeota bacterium MED-G18]|tara:strand:- start:1049 stop:1435 length:387 start_codon:yes stop_codon:yes gene_type:complete
MEYIISVGRRKTSVARLYMKPGKGSFVINNSDLNKYFSSELLRLIVEQPLKSVDALNKFDFKVNIHGGGLKGQAEAIRLAVSRALVKNDEENRPVLKKEGFLTRDPRMVERKKYGRRKARRAFQWVKR